MYQLASVAEAAEAPSKRMMKTAILIAAPLNLRGAVVFLGNIRARIIEVNSSEQAKKFYQALPQMYPELTNVTCKFEIQEAETLEHVLALLLDVIIDKYGFDLASELMEKMHNSTDHEKLIQELQTQYPAEFQICLQRFSQRFA